MDLGAEHLEEKDVYKSYNGEWANGCQLDCWLSNFHPTRTKGARSARHRCLASCLPPKTTTKSSQRACESCPTSVFAHAFVQLCEIFLLLPFSVQIQSVSNCATCLPKGDVTVTSLKIVWRARIEFPATGSDNARTSHLFLETNVSQTSYTWPKFIGRLWGYPC